MEKIYRQVSIKERLPEKEGKYHTNVGLVYFHGKEFYHWIEWWLEEIEIPTYEDTRKARDAYSYSYLDPFRWGWRYGVKHILNTLKGEKR